MSLPASASHPSQTSRRGATLWPLGIALAYGSFAAAMIGFTVWSTGHKEELVSPDYYARTVTHQEHIDAVARARPLPVSLALESGSGLRIRTPPGLAGVARDARVNLYRPSSAALDRQVAVTLDPSGDTRAPLQPALAAGWWRATLEWTLEGKAYCVDTAFTAP